MYFIGIIANENDFEFLSKCMCENAKENKSKFEILNLNGENAEYVKNIKFDLVIINTDLNKINNNYLKEILLKSKYIMINSDLKMKEIKDFNIKSLIITYGLNQKATITMSSIEENEILICLQRNIKNIDNNVIEPFEEYIKNSTKNAYISFIMFGFLLIFKGKS